jgi:hypothetical protein
MCHVQSTDRRRACPVVCCSSQDQYVYEGVVIGLMNLACGLSFVGAYYASRKSNYRVVQYIGERGLNPFKYEG